MSLARLPSDTEVEAVEREIKVVSALDTVVKALGGEGVRVCGVKEESDQGQTSTSLQLEINGAGFKRADFAEALRRALGDLRASED